MKPPSLPSLLLHALFITIASHALPYYLFFSFLFHPSHSHARQNITYDLLALATALLLTLPTPRRSGLTLGAIRPHWWKVLLICAIPITLTAIIYPLTSKPFKNASISMWLISPLAQDLIFVGYLYPLFADRSTHQPLKKIPINTPLLLTALFFALWHLPNLQSFPTSYVLFQLAYVFLGTLFTGTTRILTGSILYITLTHTAMNYIAWSTP